jgi:hypothetical protein
MTCPACSVPHAFSEKAWSYIACGRPTSKPGQGEQVVLALRLRPCIGKSERRSIAERPLWMVAVAVRQRRGSGAGPGRPARPPALAPAPPGAGEACLADAWPTRPAHRPQPPCPGARGRAGSALPPAVGTGRGAGRAEDPPARPPRGAALQDPPGRGAGDNLGRHRDVVERSLAWLVATGGCRSATSAAPTSCWGSYPWPVRCSA